MRTYFFKKRVKSGREVQRLTRHEELETELNLSHAITDKMVELPYLSVLRAFVDL